MGRSGKAALIVLAPFLLLLPIMLMSATSSTKASGGATGITGVPQDYVAHVLRAGAICPEVSPPVIAAQLRQESGFSPTAVSPAGAQGIAQFMPGTWASVGKDGDGDGVADVLNPADAIFSQGHYMCGQVEAVKGLVAGGRVSGDVLELALAAYNAGLGNVITYGGIPPFSETQHYVRAVIDGAKDFTVTAGGPAAQSADSLDPGATYDASGLTAEAASMSDPTPGAHGTAAVTPRMHRLISDVMTTYPQIVLPPLYCWDAHTFNPTSDHSTGRACDIPFYGCHFGDVSRTADPSTGLKAGNAAASWLVTNASAYGISYVIWAGQIWESGTGWQPYTGAAGSDPGTCSGGHYDHIHVSVY